MTIHAQRKQIHQPSANLFRQLGIGWNDHIVPKINAAGPRDLWFILSPHSPQRSAGSSHHRAHGMTIYLDVVTIENKLDGSCGHYSDYSPTQVWVVL
jgi:hypothetical protein